MLIAERPVARNRTLYGLDMCKIPVFPVTLSLQQPCSVHDFNWSGDGLISGWSHEVHSMISKRSNFFAARPCASWLMAPLAAERPTPWQIWRIGQPLNWSVRSGVSMQGSKDHQKPQDFEKEPLEFEYVAIQESNFIIFYHIFSKFQVLSLSSRHIRWPSKGGIAAIKFFVPLSSKLGTQPGNRVGHRWDEIGNHGHLHLESLALESAPEFGHISGRRIK